MFKHTACYRNPRDDVNHNNPDLVAATYRIEQARARTNAAQSDWFPEFGGSAGATVNYGSRNAGQVAPGGNRSTESYDLTEQLTWELDLWGGIRAARSCPLEAQYQRDAVQTSIVAAAYIQLKNHLIKAQATTDCLPWSRPIARSVVAGGNGITSPLQFQQAP